MPPPRAAEVLLVPPSYPSPILIGLDQLLDVDVELDRHLLRRLILRVPVVQDPRHSHPGIVLRAIFRFSILLRRRLLRQGGFSAGIPIIIERTTIVGTGI